MSLNPDQGHVEFLEEYHKGGFHPVHLGDLFHNNRYKVIAKIGNGTYSTVWLAEDQQADKEEVVLKIIEADETDITSELEILQFLTNVKLEHPGRKHVMTLLDHFYHTGPNGTHLGLVLPAMVTDLEEAFIRKRKSRPGMSELRRIAREMLQGVDFLHRMGIVHGDLHPGNIMIQNIMVNSTGTHYHRDGLTPVVTHPVAWDREVREDQAKVVPRYLVSSQRRTSQWTKEDLDGVEVVIGDLGGAQWSHKCHLRPVTPAVLRAPEMLGSGEFDSKADIWALGCSIFELATGKTLFLFDRWGVTEGEIRKRILESIGRRVGADGRRGFATYLADQLPKDFGVENVNRLAEFLLLMLQIDPRRRRSADALLRTPFIRDEC